MQGDDLGRRQPAGRSDFLEIRAVLAAVADRDLDESLRTFARHPAFGEHRPQLRLEGGDVGARTQMQRHRREGGHHLEHAGGQRREQTRRERLHRVFGGLRDLIAETQDQATVAEGLEPRDRKVAGRRRRGHVPRAQIASKRMVCAPSQSTLVPSARRFSRPSTIVRKWLPASCPILLAKQHEP